jgi:hypothetical protein
MNNLENIKLQGHGNIALKIETQSGEVKEIVLKRITLRASKEINAKTKENEALLKSGKISNEDATISNLKERVQKDCDIDWLYDLSFDEILQIIKAMNEIQYGTNKTAEKKS